jgi:steroid 5-alpha reductase family enzyme
MQSEHLRLSKTIFTTSKTTLQQGVHLVMKAHTIGLILLQTTNAFLSPYGRIKNMNSIPGRVETVESLRGGALEALPAEVVNLPSTVTSLVTSSLLSGPYGVVALAAISAAVILPLTQVKNMYGVSVGYGGSVAAIAYVLLQTFVPAKGDISHLLLGSSLFYGIRLASFLFVRDVAGWKPPASREEPSRMKRVPFALSLAIFYGLMTTPLLYAMRTPSAVGTSLHRVSMVGTGIAWAGAILEAVADGHKFLSKLNVDPKSKAFTGPSTGVYTMTRHPNYSGEVLFWVGTFVAGAPSFGKSIIAWLSSTAGLYGIVSIMNAATKGLEKRQGEKYGGQKAYETWKSDVPYPLVPLIKA